jgi:hypothetical protein
MRFKVTLRRMVVVEAYVEGTSVREVREKVKNDPHEYMRLGFEISDNTTVSSVNAVKG